MPIRAYSAVRCLYPQSTIICIGTGPSLTLADVDLCRGRAHVIAVNDAYALAPWAEVLYAADSTWWKWHQSVPDDAMPALKYTVDPQAVHWRPSVNLLNFYGATGLDNDPTKLRHGGHSGYQAINLAVHLGASTIILLGYDMQRGPAGGVPNANHFFGEHPNKHHLNYPIRVGAYHSLLYPLQQRNIAIVNASRRTALTAIPRMSLEEALATAHAPAQVLA